MPVMKVTLSVRMPDVGKQALIWSAKNIQKPILGFVEHLIRKQHRWLPNGTTVEIDAIEVSVELEATPGDVLHREIEHDELVETRKLAQRARSHNARPAVREPAKLAA
jgi:hypothetical protein